VPCAADSATVSAGARQRPRLGALALAAGLVLTACAPGGGRAAASPSDEPILVHVTLADFAIASSQSAFVPLKRYRFIVRNDGSLAHELLVLPPVKPGLMTPEAMRALALGVVEARNLPPGGGHVLDLAFDKAYPAGALELACHILGHYEAGQRLPIVVR